jgi:hypothetical protein
LTIALLLRDTVAHNDREKLAMAEHVNDLTVSYEEDGRVVVEEIDKAILSKGAWATILYKYREYDRRKEEMGKVKFSLRRYQKRNGIYQQKGKFNISSEDQATAIVDTLGTWIK